MFDSRMWSWVLLNVIVVLCSTLNGVAEPNHATLVGTVYCDTCASHLIQGASVAVECGGDGVQASGQNPRFREEVKTDEKGEFRVELPFFISKHVKMIKGCSVKLINSSEPDCAETAIATPSSIWLKVKTAENRVFTAGFFTFKPRKQPELCNMEPGIKNSGDELNTPAPFWSPETQTTSEPNDFSDANAFGLPFPQNPFRPPLLVSPFPFQPPPESMFTPVFQPPPESMFNPIPFQTPPESVFNPQPFQQPPPSFTPEALPPPPPPPLPPPFLFPPLETQPGGFIQSPPAMPPPALLPPFPPFPFQPTPGFPGMPPATSSIHLKKITSP